MDIGIVWQDDNSQERHFEIQLTFDGVPHVALDATHVFEQDVELVVRDFLGVECILKEPNLATLFELPRHRFVCLALFPCLKIPQRFVLSS